MHFNIKLTLSIKTKKTVLLLGIVFSCFLTVAQQLPNVVPPSPKSQEFNKYINFEVSYYNGLPEISIPLYSINIKGVSVPINLSYHASGIKYKQEDSDVGVGWILNPGYRISRTVNGFPDELKNMPTNLVDSIINYLSNNSNLQTDNFLAKFLHPAPNSRPSSNNNSQYDGEFDIFNFSAPENEGSFIITDRQNKLVTNIEYSNVKTSYSTIPSTDGFTYGITGLQIRDTKGNKFSYGEWKPRGSNFVFEANTGNYGGFIPTAWAMTDIENMVGENIHFDYSKQMTGGWDGNSQNITFTEAVHSSSGTGIDFPSNVSGAFGGYDAGYSTFALNTIITPNERIEFTRPITQYGKHISEINIYKKDNSLLRKIAFSYSHNDYQVFLDSVRVYGASLSNPETYRFEYFDKNTDFTLAPLVPDQWGYYKIESNRHQVFHDEFGSDYLDFSTGGQMDNWNHEIRQYMPGHAKRDQIFAIPRYFTLKKIVYPTGGNINYDFDYNKIANGPGISKNVGGIRIKSITANDLTGGTILRRFEYGENEDGNGYPTLYLNPGHFVEETLTMRPEVVDGQMRAQRAITYSSQIQGDIALGGFLSNNVIYPKVTEYYSSSLNTVNGKTTYTYDLGDQYGVSSMPATIYPNPDATANSLRNMSYHYGYPQYITRYNSWNKPILTQVDIFSGENTLYNKVQQTKFNYSSSFITYTGLKVRPFAAADPYSPNSSNAYYSFISSFFNYSTYSLNVGLKQLIGKEETIFNSGVPVKTENNFTYNSFNQLIKEVKLNSKNELLETEKKYPKEMIESSQDPTGIYQQMIMENYLDPVIIETKKIGNNELDKSFTNYYTPYASLFVPQTVKTKNLLSGIMEERLNYFQYDVKGNPISLSLKDNIKVNYLFAYKSQHPVLEIKNADYSAIVNALGGLTVISTLAGSNPDKTTIDGLAATLKGALPTAQITTYTYDPLIGMTSQTDAKGMTTYYEYDEFQRLKYVKDHYGNIIKANSYHYRN